MKLTIYTSNSHGDAKNIVYPNETTIDLTQPLDVSIFGKDYVASLFKNHTRANDNFVKTNCILVDIDNDHSDKPNEWFSEEDIEDALRGVPYIIHFSRHHLVDKQIKKSSGAIVIKEKRPKFHLIIPINEVSSKEEFDNLMTRFAKYFPFIDSKDTIFNESANKIGVDS